MTVFFNDEKLTKQRLKEPSELVFIDRKQLQKEF